MLDVIKALAKNAFSSRKFLALIVGLLAVLLSLALVKWLGLEHEEALQLSTTVAASIVGLVGSYLVGQGVADHGKEKQLAKGLQAKELAQLAKDDPHVAQLVARLLGPADGDRGSGEAPTS